MRLRPISLLLGLGLVVFTPFVLQPSGVLYSDYSDFVNYHLPFKYFLARSWQATGELPRWCPEIFSGMPYLHDAQATVFYPLHFPLLLVLPGHQGAAYSWLIVVHVLLGGLCMYAYARHQGLHGAGALVAALGYMLAGKWLLHLLVSGHYNVAPLAWLPLVFLLSERAIQRRSLLHAVGAGGVFSLIVLGAHPQMTFYSGVFIALWTLLTALEQTEGWEKGEPFSWQRAGVALRRWVGLGLVTALVALLLASVQVLPALDATRASSRTLGVPFRLEETIQGMQLTFIGLVGPPLIREYSCYWEFRGGLGLVWLAVAVCAPVLVPTRRVRWQAGAAVVILLLGLGGLVLLQWLPGFHLWRLPSRMLMLLALPSSLLVGHTTQALFTANPTVEQRSLCQRILLQVSCYVLLPLGICAVLQHLLERTLLVAPYWFSLPVTVPLAWWLFREAGRGSESPARDQARFPAGSLPWLWGGVLFADLALLVFPLVEVRAEADIFTPSACARYLAERQAEHGRVLDISPINPDDKDDRSPACATPLWPNFPMVVGVEPVLGYNPLDVLRYKEYLQFIMDQDEPLRALHHLTFPGIAAFPLTNGPLADLLGIRYLVMPSNMPLEWFVPDAQTREKAWVKVFEDTRPHAYSFVPKSAKSHDAGLISLPPYTVYENRNALPRAFVVPEARLLPDRPRVLAELKATDFRRCVLLEGWDGRPWSSPPEATVASSVRIDHYRPNEVALNVQTSAPGWLVLTDIWFPGWTCTVDDETTPIYRANYLFRAVEMPAGSHRVVFRFVPRSYELGQIISLTALGLMVGIFGLSGMRLLLSTRKTVASTAHA